MSAEVIIRAVVWDLGGVLLRTEDYSSRTSLAKQYNITLQELEDLVFGSETGSLAEAGQIPEEQHHRFIGDQLGVGMDEMQDFMERFFAGDRMDRDLLSYVRNLRPRYKVGLLSNAWESARQILEQRHGFLDVFDIYIFSAEVKIAKPDRRVYHMILDDLGVTPGEAVFIDDNHDNVMAASEVGMRAIQFKDPQQVRQELGGLLQSPVES